MENQKQGHFALFRSLLSKEWASDTAKFALWVRIIGQAQYKSRTVEFDGVSWDLQAGQLVTKVSILARKLKDSQGNEKSPKQVRDMLEFFTKEKMITFSGNRHGTVITIINYTDYQGDFEVTNEVGNEVTNKRSAGAASGVVGVTKQVTNEVEQSKKLLEQEYKNITQTREAGLSGEKKLTSRQAGTNPRARGTNPRAALPDFDRPLFVQTWNRKAEAFGLPRIKGITTTTENGIKRLWKSYLKHCKDTGNQPTSADAFLTGYITHGYKPTRWACGENPDGTKYGIDTALTQKMIDKVISEEV
ncbi:replication protein [Pantoea wallisii]|nr:replication protein [Pantoea wallisii]